MDTKPCPIATKNYLGESMEGQDNFLKIDVPDKKLKSVKNRGNIPGGPGVKNLPASTRDRGLIPGPGRFHMPQSK